MDFFYVAGIIISLLLGIWNIINSYRISRTTSFINTVTAERVRWIETVRKNIAEFCQHIYFFSASKPDDQETKELQKRVDNLRHVIKLYLNPQGAKEQRISTLIDEMLRYTDPHHNQTLKITLDELITVTQSLLKQEWDKVRDEAKWGDLREEPTFGDIVLAKSDAKLKRIFRLKVAE